MNFPERHIPIHMAVYGSHSSFLSKFKWSSNSLIKIGTSGFKIRFVSKVVCAIFSLWLLKCETFNFLELWVEISNSGMMKPYILLHLQQLTGKMFLHYPILVSISLFKSVNANACGWNFHYQPLHYKDL